MILPKSITLIITVFQLMFPLQVILICVELILKPTITIQPHAQVCTCTKPFEMLAQPILGLKMVGKHLQMASDWPRITCVSEVPQGETQRQWTEVKRVSGIRGWAGRVTQANVESDGK